MNGIALAEEMARCTKPPVHARKLSRLLEVYKRHPEVHDVVRESLAGLFVRTSLAEQADLAILLAGLETNAFENVVLDAVRSQLATKRAQFVNPTGTTEKIEQFYVVKLFQYLIWVRSAEGRALAESLCAEMGENATSRALHRWLDQYKPS